MGDNVTFNDGLARELGLMRGKCLPHALNLVVDDALGLFCAVKGACFKDLVVKAGGLITAGGTTRRVSELKGPSYNLMPNKMKVYENRFSSSLLANKYRLINFAAVKRWHTEGESLKVELASETAQKEDAKQKERTAVAYKDVHAQLIMAVVDGMYGGISELIPVLSGDGDSVPPSILNRLARLRSTFRMHAADGSMVITSCCAAVGITTDAARKVAVAKFKPVVEASAKAAIAKWDKHVPSTVTNLRRRFQYSPFSMPPQRDEAVPTAEFLGCYPEELTVDLIADWKEYCADRKRHYDSNPSLWTVEEAREDIQAEAVLPFVEYWSPPGAGAGAGGNLNKGDRPATGTNCHMFLPVAGSGIESSVRYWNGKKSRWQQLAKTALFWLEFNTSSIAAERVFAVIRKMDLPGRAAMASDTFRREIFFRINRRVLEGLLEATRKDLVNQW